SAALRPRSIVSAVGRPNGRTRLRNHELVARFGRGTLRMRIGAIFLRAFGHPATDARVRALREGDEAQRLLATVDGGFVASARRTSECRTPRESWTMSASPSGTTLRPDRSRTAKRS